MKWVYLFKLVLLMALVMPVRSIAQEEESAEISLEENTDEFQELFFEALKQKGIENYDKAINALLKCKEIDPQSHVVDHELAKTYQLNDQFALAQEYALSALNQHAGNLWYLNTYLSIVGLGESNFDSLKDQIPFDNVRLKENLIEILVDKKQYDLAKRVLKIMKKSGFTVRMTARMDDAQAQENQEEEVFQADESVKADDPLERLMNTLRTHLENEDYEALNTLSTEALEEYPLQPFLYYAKGLALNQASDFRQAADYLTMGLDFIYENDKLTLLFYTELAKAYKGLGDTPMANMYLSKMKNRS
ncbi:tetratricopeptide repeat protein [Muriicola soli]|uniref:Tetratricopeptide repeat protein n=1 Tax=Muriicola soli TaxID=2507538 RepID=A0A411ECT0_9FLAO|nr:hypothetical protein [Muriicola soli]QBA65438.1 hypothetical protein EQY75_13385 [Muriicola soli]